MAAYHDHLDAVNEGLAAALGHLANLRLAMAGLDQAGRYDAAPTSEAHEPRQAGGLYMRLYFGRAGGRYKGPGGRRKLYIGADPEAQAEAHRLAENARRWEVLDQAAQDLERWIAQRRAELEALAGQCQDWPRAELLGPVVDTEGR